jgi:fumarylacetoacetate (FAA) hydrolase family protein
MIDCLPKDWQRATLVGRLSTAAGPTPILIREGRVRDVSRQAPTMSQLLNEWSGAIPSGDDQGPLESLGSSAAYEALREPRLLSPFDLQCIKACGVTFAISAIERVIEERARGDAAKAESIRSDLRDRVGSDIRAVKPGSDAAQRLKQALIADGLWSQYLEVALGPDAEVFTKGPVLSSVGWGDWIGVRADSAWNNPEPEIVLACDRNGRIVGASLGNDVNLRDIEGRSALLLGKAKDNNASCSIGPFVRLFDDGYGLDDVRRAELDLKVTGEDGFVLHGKSSMSQISRDPTDLVKQTVGAHHQYPDGFMLFLGTLFAPTQDRDAKNQGFTHKIGDVVEISSAGLGALVNTVRLSTECPPWTFGISSLMGNLAKRGLL